MAQPPDEILIQKAKSGDRKAFEALYQKYKRPILNFAYRLIGNKETAEEITQETFVRVYLNLARFDPRGKVSSWIYTIAGNLAKNELRDKKYFHDISLDKVIFGDDKKIRLRDVVLEGKDKPDKVLEDKELQDQIQKVIDAIPARYREVLVLCDVQGLSYEEAARIVGCSVGTIASRLSRARVIFMKKFGTDIGRR